MPVSTFLGSWTILFLLNSLLGELDDVEGLFRRLSGAKWLIKFRDLIRSLFEGRCIVRLRVVETDPYSGRSKSLGAGGQLPPIKLYKSSC